MKAPARRIRRLFAALTLPAACLIAEQAAAAPDRPGFFSRNFAVEGTVSKRDPFFEPRRGISPVDQEKSALPVLTPSEPKPAPEITPAAETSAPASERTFGSGPAAGEALTGGLKIERLSLLVNGGETKHLDEQLTELLALSRDRGLQIDRVHITDFGKALAGSNQAAALIKAGARVQDGLYAREDYPVQRSPTWILQTAEGVVLLEGVKPGRYITRRGEFVDRSAPSSDAGLSQELRTNEKW